MPFNEEIDRRVSSEISAWETIRKKMFGGTCHIILISFAILFIGHCLLPGVHAQDPQVVVKIQPKYKETSYKMIINDRQEISLITYQTEINKGILRLRSDSDLSLNRQIDLLAIILERVFKDVNKDEIHTLFIGRLINAFGTNNTQMSERLALSVYKSHLWDNTQGRPVSDHENVAVKTIANEARIFPELRQVFSRHGLLITVSGVEKVLINQPDLTPIGDALKFHGVTRTAKLPYDCLMWFSVSKTGD